VATLVGQTASLLSPIPENGVGKSPTSKQHPLHRAGPFREGMALSQGQNVRITRIVGTQFFVEPVS